MTQATAPTSLPSAGTPPATTSLARALEDSSWPSVSGLDLPPETLLNLIATALCLVIASLVIVLSRRWVARLAITDVDDKARLVSFVRNLTLFAATLALVLLWNSQLKVASLPLAAFAVAFVIATKEVILCLLGGLYRVSAGAFSVGDRVSIGELRGEVIETGFFTTRLLEIGPWPVGHGRTGSVMVLPNSRLFTDKLINESLPGRYILHSFEICIPRPPQLEPLHSALTDIVSHECARDLKAATKHLERFRTHHQLLYPETQPRVCLYFRDGNQVMFFIRFPVLETAKSKRQQAITYRFMLALDAVNASDGGA